MIVYRITLEKWSDKLTASGSAARWNANGKFVLYTAGTRALACLENVVHRSGEGLNNLFKVMLIEIPDGLKQEEVKLSTLPVDWHEFIKYRHCQQIGNEWLDSGRSAVLKVPSAIVKKEHNYLLNPNHPYFKKIKLIDIEDFRFDPRLKG